MAKIIFFKNSEQDVHMKVISEGGGGSIDLTFDELASDIQEVTPNAKVTIRNVQWSGEPDGILRIKRAGERIMSLTSNPQGLMQFDGQQFCAESHNSKDGFTFEFEGSPMEAWIWLKKSDFKNKAGEYATYGAYEDDNRVGARTDLSGSPDYPRVIKTAPEKSIKRKRTRKTQK